MPCRLAFSQRRQGTESSVSAPRSRLRNPGRWADTFVGAAMWSAAAWSGTVWSGALPTAVAPSSVSGLMVRTTSTSALAAPTWGSSMGNMPFDSVRCPRMSATVGASLPRNTDRHAVSGPLITNFACLRSASVARRAA